MNEIYEKCGCGAEYAASSGTMAALVLGARYFREAHDECRRKPEKPTPASERCDCPDLDHWWHRTCCVASSGAPS